jgi:hypothetical protein
MSLTFSQWLPEREDNVFGVEGVAYKVLHRPGAGIVLNGQVCFKYTSLLFLELRFLLAVRKVIQSNAYIT